MLNMKNKPIIVSVAGSDSSGGAGIQADIKTISALGGYAASIITALTAQNTQGVQSVLSISTLFIEEQFDSVFSDLNVKAVKIGMLDNPTVIKVVAKKLRQYRPEYIVLDPVMVSTSGNTLLQEEAIETLKTELLPLCHIVTPNQREARLLFGKNYQSTLLHSELKKYNLTHVLITGGDNAMMGKSVDFLITDVEITRYSSSMINSKNTHGTGCSLSSAIALFLSVGYPMKEAIKKAKKYVFHGIKEAQMMQIGQGRGPIWHFNCANKVLF